MPVRNCLIVGVLWLASLVAVAATGRAQAPQPAPNPAVQPRVVSGDDIGFRIERWQGKTPVGTLVIRVDGKWVEPGAAKKMMPLTR